MGKISSYGAIVSVQTDDLLPVVDVHDTTMAPTGTTKKMALSQLPFLPASDSLAVIATANPAGADVPMNSHKLTGLGNGSAAGDSAAFGQVLSLKAGTPLAGYTLVNGTGTIISWAAPNDGVNHRVLLITNQQITSGATGGQVTATVTTPDGNTSSPQVYAVNQGGGFHSPNAFMFTVKPGTTFTLQQATALTGGAGAVFAEIWAL